MDLQALNDALSKLDPEAQKQAKALLSWKTYETKPPWFHDGQTEAWESEARFVAVIAGNQSGKTVTGPPWLIREIQRRGPGEYMICGPSLKLLKLKALPEFVRVWQDEERLGVFNKSELVFTMSDEGSAKLFGRYGEKVTIFTGHADNPQSLESATLKGLIFEEAGQDACQLASWYALLRRLGVNQGRVLFPTTPYSLGWLYQEVYLRAEGGDPDYDVVRYESRMNPAFPLEEWERARRQLPAWEFDMLYRAIFRRPAGLVYDCIDESSWVEPFEIPATWQKYVGIDFGTINMAAVVLAEDPSTGILYLTGSYHSGGKNIETHVQSIEKVAQRRRESLYAAGGNKTSEHGWRVAFGSYGLPIQEPLTQEVFVGIQTVYGLIKTGRLKFFKGCKGIQSETETYKYRLDVDGNPIPGQIVNQNAYHRLDALRGICVQLRWADGGGKDERESRKAPEGDTDPWQRAKDRIESRERARLEQYGEADFDEYEFDRELAGAFD